MMEKKFDLKDLLKAEHLLGNDDYVTNEEILLTKKHLKADKFWNKGLIDKLKKHSKGNIRMEVVPFEPGRSAWFTDYKLDWSCYEYILMKNSNKKDTVTCFDKRYIDFIRKYIKPWRYTIIYNHKTDGHLLKFWNKNNEFLGCLASCQILHCTNIVR